MIANDPSGSRLGEGHRSACRRAKVPAALTTLPDTAKNDRSTKVRSQALFWLAQKAGREAVAADPGAIENGIPDTEVKKKAVFALSQLPRDEGVPSADRHRAQNKPESRGPTAGDLLAGPVARPARDAVLRGYSG